MTTIAKMIIVNELANLYQIKSYLAVEKDDEQRSNRLIKAFEPGWIKRTT